ncbi:NAD(P)-dependent oxidoreductase [Azospirillaceae bacterium]
MPHLFCFGLGYCAQTLIRSLDPKQWRVSGTYRHTPPEPTNHLPVNAYLFDRNHSLPPAGRAHLADASHILVSVPPDSIGDPVLDCHRSDLLHRYSAPYEWIGYLSSVGVYGDAKGEWVDENTPPNPLGERQIRRRRAEQEWENLFKEYGLPVHRFRLAGIYGYNRNIVQSIRAGTAQRIDVPGQVFNRIHVDDVSQVLQASIAHPQPGAVYAVADDFPCPAHEVVGWACERLGVPTPPMIPIEQARLTPMGASFYRENRRVRNDRIKNELGVRLRHPNYQSGLEGILQSSR